MEMTYFISLSVEYILLGLESYLDQLPLARDGST